MSSGYAVDPVRLILEQLILPLGEPYGKLVQDWQLDFFRAVFATNPDGNPAHRLVYDERRRGESKTEDMAAVALTDLLTGPERHRSWRPARIRRSCSSIPSAASWPGQRS